MVFLRPKISKWPNKKTSTSAPPGPPHGSPIPSCTQGDFTAHWLHSSRLVAPCTTPDCGLRVLRMLQAFCTIATNIHGQGLRGGGKLWGIFKELVSDSMQYLWGQGSHLGQSRRSWKIPGDFSATKLAS